MTTYFSLVSEEVLLRGVSAIPFHLEDFCVLCLRTVHTEILELWFAPRGRQTPGCEMLGFGTRATKMDPFATWVAFHPPTTWAL